MKEIGQSHRQQPNETYLGDTETAKKIADARRAARPIRTQEDRATHVTNLRAQIVALLESADIQELLKWAHEGKKIPWHMRRRAYQIEARRKLILNRLKAGGS